jgi:acetyl-CoA acetyltransferase
MRLSQSPDGPLRGAAAVVGVGTTAYGELPGCTTNGLAADALAIALDDAGLSAGDIDGLIVSRASSYEAVASASGIQPAWTAQLPAEGRMTGPAIQLAAVAISSGLAHTVAIAYGNDGRSGGHTYGGGGASATRAAEGYGIEDALLTPYGMTSPGAFYALMFERHRQLFGTSAEQLSTVATTFREHAALNPAAVFQQPLARADYLESRFIVEPLRIYDYCLINDGGVALIVTAAARAVDRRHPPAYILGFGQQGQLVGSDFPPEDFWHNAIGTVGRSSYAMAGCDRGDIDVLMAYDNFSPNVLFTLEGLGYCHPGESGEWIQNGRISLSGALPVNTSGGHLSESYMQGWALNAEAVRQIRGACDQRQVRNVELAQYVCAAPIVSSVIYGGSR